MSNARVVDIKLVAYHKDTSSISHSGLELVISNPEEYYYERLNSNARERKRWFEEGQALEDALMRPGPVGNGMIVIPDEGVLAKGGAKSGKAWYQFEADHPGKVLVKKTDLIYHQIEAVKRHDDARKLIEAAGRYQETIYWHDDDFDADCRLRMDKLIAAERPLYIVDLKTDRSDCSVKNCTKAIEHWGYDRQAEWYRRGVKEYYGEEIPFIFIFVSKSLPIRVQTIQLSDAWYPEAKKINDRGLRTFARCKATNSWLPEQHGATIVVEPSPNRGKYSNDWEYEHGERSQSESEAGGQSVDPSDRRDAGGATDE